MISIFVTEFVESFLTHPRFEIVHSTAVADILWFRSHVKDYLQFSEESPNRFVNQFPYEHVLTVKDLLAIVCRRGAKGGLILGEFIDWIVIENEVKYIRDR